MTLIRINGRLYPVMHPYVPLQMLRATDPDTFVPKLGFKTRYGLMANPFQ